MFPFLAVLLCTIGALVLILVISVVHSRATAERFMDSEITERLEQAKESSDIMESVSEELQARREKVKQEIERRRRELANIEDHIARMNQEMEQLHRKAEAIEAAEDLDETEQKNTENQLSEIREEIEKKKRELAEEIEKQKKRKPAFAILPYAGPNGTSRRPVYLECRKEGVVIQPEGVLISFADLRPPHGPGNPLDAALRVLRNAYQEKDATFGLMTPPYPLLIVRPDGIHSYALARAAMSGWDDQFGYELIDNEMELAFPPGTPELANNLKSALEIAKRRQEALLASLPRQYVRSREMANDDEEGDSLFGNRSNSNYTASGGNDWGDEPNAGYSGAAVSEENNRWKMVKELQQGQVVAQGDEGTGGPSGRGTARPQGPDPRDRSSFQNNAPSLSSGVASSGTLGSTDLTGSYETVQGQSPTALQNLPGRGASAGTSVGASSDQVPSGNGPQQGAGQQGQQMTGMNRTGGTTAGGAAAGGAASYGSPNASSSNANSRANAFSSGTANGMSSTSLNSGSSSASSDPNQVQGSIQDSKYQDSKMADSMPQPQVNMSVQSPSASKDPKSSSQKNSPDHSNSAVARKNAARSDSDSKPISISAGKGWATSRIEGKASPVSRPIRIVALSDRWLLRSESNETKIDTEVMLDTGPQQASSDLERAIRERVDSWGPSLPGGYWSPTVTIESASDANLSVQRMQRLLDGSGVDIRVVPLQAPPQKKSR